MDLSLIKSCELSSRDYVILDQYCKYLTSYKFPYLLNDYNFTIHNITENWDKYKEVLCLACKYGNFNIIKYLINLEIAKNTNIPYEALLNASENGHLDIIKYLVSAREHTEINIYDGDDEEALSFACKNGHFNIVKYLIEIDSSNSLIHANNDEALIIASEYNHFDIVHYLISQGANIRDNINTVLYWAMTHNNYEIINYLNNTESIEDTVDDITQYIDGFSI